MYYIKYVLYEICMYIYDLEQYMDKWPKTLYGYMPQN